MAELAFASLCRWRKQKAEDLTWTLDCPKVLLPNGR